MDTPRSWLWTGAETCRSAFLFRNYCNLLMTNLFVRVTLHRRCAILSLFTDTDTEHRAAFSPKLNMSECSIFLRNLSLLCVISGFRRTADESCVLLGYYVVSNDDAVPVPWPLALLNPEEVTERFYRNVGKKLPLLGVSYWGFGTTYWSHDPLVPWPLKMGPKDCTETSVRNYHYWRFLTEVSGQHTGPMTLWSLGP